MPPPGRIFNCFLADGSALDTTFGSTGLRYIDFGDAADTGNALAIDNHGRIIGAGTTGSSAAVLRLTASGDLDTSFC